MNFKYRILALGICLMLISNVSGIAAEMETVPDSTAVIEEIPAAAEPIPETVAEPMPEAPVESTPEAAAEPTPEATAESMPAAIAEPIPEATAESTPEAIDESYDLPVIEAEIVSPDPSEDPAETDVPFLPELTLPPVEIQADEIAGVAAGSNYSWGYAKLTLPTTGYASASPDAEAIIYLEKGVFFVSSRRASSSSDRLRVHFANNGETRSVWVDERRLRPMSAGEVLDFVNSALGKSEVHLYNGNPMLPLDEAACSSVITYSKPAQTDEHTVPAMFVNQTQLSLDIGDVQPIGVSFSDNTGHAVQFTSDNENIASVSEDGRVTGIAAGTTWVRIKSEFSNVAMVEILVQE